MELEVHISWYRAETRNLRGIRVQAYSWVPRLRPCSGRGPRRVARSSDRIKIGSVTVPSHTGTRHFRPSGRWGRRDVRVSHCPTGGRARPHAGQWETPRHAPLKTEVEPEDPCHFSSSSWQWVPLSVPLSELPPRRLMRSGGFHCQWLLFLCCASSAPHDLIRFRGPRLQGPRPHAAVALQPRFLSQRPGSPTWEAPGVPVCAPVRRAMWIPGAFEVEFSH